MDGECLSAGRGRHQPVNRLRAHLPARGRSGRENRDEEVAAATTRLVARGRLNADGTAADAGIAAREQIEVETDEHCAALWTPIGDANVRRLTSLIKPIHDTFPAAGTYPFRVASRHAVRRSGGRQVVRSRWRDIPPVKGLEQRPNGQWRQSVLTNL
ncbi:helix-turn-helix domain-containing protein [Spirillospora sp. CA-255316]